MMNERNELTILLLISWKWISHTLSTTSSLSNVTKANPIGQTTRVNKSRDPQIQRTSTAPRQHNGPIL